MTAPSLRVVNYHLTPAARAGTLDRELAALAGRFAPVREDDLAEYLTTRRWPMRRPGVLPVFYNGYRNNFDVARPLLERHGLVGWFMAVTGFSGCEVSGQARFAAEHHLATLPGEYPDGRLALSWDELRVLDTRHVVASHTRSHTRASASDAGLLEDEIVGAQRDFIDNLGHPVRSCAWLLGGRCGDNPRADAALARAGHEFLFSNFAVQRLPVGPRR